MWLVTISGQDPKLCKTAEHFAAYVQGLMGEVFEVQYVSVWEPPPPGEEKPTVHLKTDYKLPEPLSGDSE